MTTDDAATPKLRRTPLPRVGYLIARGVESDEEDIRQLATLFRRRYPAWAAYGVSAYHAADDSEVLALCQAQLLRWENVAVFLVEDILTAGIAVSPTFRTPHVTLSHPDLDELLNRLNHAPHEIRHNPYHEE